MELVDFFRSAIFSIGGYAGYDPLFSWWTDAPYERLDDEQRPPIPDGGDGRLERRCSCG